MPVPLVVAQSRAVPVEVERAFAQTLTMPLTSIFSQRYGLLPPVSQIRDQHEAWGRTGQTRTVVTRDGGTMRELLVDVDAPRSFSYRLSDVTGVLRPLIAGIDGRWEFVPTGTGTSITWSWTVHPTSAGALVLPVVMSRLWPGYARLGLEQLSEQLLAPASGGSASA